MTSDTRRLARFLKERGAIRHERHINRWILRNGRLSKARKKLRALQPRGSSADAS